MTERTKMQFPQSLNLALNSVTQDIEVHSTFQEEILNVVGKTRTQSRKQRKQTWGKNPAMKRAYRKGCKTRTKTT